MNVYDVILTGIKRSGTTLTCHLLNKAPNTVALHEPMKVSQFADCQNRDELRAFIEGFFAKARNSIKVRGKAITKHVDGKVPDNTFSVKQAGDRWRKNLGVKKGEIAIAKQLADDFLLCVKHPAAFTAILEKLAEDFPCFAIVRNPLSILTSWNSIDMPTAKGRLPAAERLDAALAQALANIKNKFDRQIHLLNWHFEKYRRVLPNHAVLRYEDIVASRGKCLAIITPNAARLDELLENQNKNKTYDFALMQTLGEKLLNADGACWEYYTKESVEALLKI